MGLMNSEQALRYFTDVKSAYRQTFGDAHGKAVLDDLTPFCRARETCVVPGDRDRTYVLEGRREVFLRIKDFLELPVEQLVATYTKHAGEANG